MNENMQNLPLEEKYQTKNPVLDRNRAVIFERLSKLSFQVNNAFKNDLDTKIKNQIEGISSEEEIKSIIENIDAGFYKNIENVASSLFLLRESIRKVIEKENEVLKTPRNELLQLTYKLDAYDKNYNTRHDYEYNAVLTGFINSIKKYLIAYMTEYNYENEAIAKQ